VWASEQFLKFGRKEKALASSGMALIEGQRYEIEVMYATLT
jgi:hypothetical protein